MKINTRGRQHPVLFIVGVVLAVLVFAALAVVITVGTYALLAWAIISVLKWTGVIAIGLVLL